VIPILVALAWADPRPGRVGVGILLMGIGEAIRLWGAAHLGATARSSTPRAGKLVTTGPYARTRHPLYWGNLCLTLGFVTASGAFWPVFPALAAIGFVFLYARHARAEERILAAAFPEAHAAWQRVVPGVRWRLRPARVAPQGETGAPSWGRALRVEAGSLHAEFWLLVALRLRAGWGA
jgi:protein-S-isoprenylcysteine O-methyltransferase Ste14